jgi:hypothetical protein
VSGLVPPVPIELLDGPHGLLYGNRAMIALEDSGHDFEKSGERRSLTTLLWAGMLHEDPKRTLDDVIDLVDPKQYVTLWGAVNQALLLAKGEEDTPAGKPEATA